MDRKEHYGAYRGNLETLQHLFLPVVGNQQGKSHDTAGADGNGSQSSE